MHADIGHLEYYNRAINTVKHYLDPRSLRRAALHEFFLTRSRKGTNTGVWSRAHLATNTRRSEYIESAVEPCTGNGCGYWP